MQAMRLVVAERDERINFRRPPRWYPASQHSDDQQQQRNHNGVLAATVH